tara:strand:+ start:130186 stop:131844 length:1659 start_codon:yes stop_codon:yes gene_type:complete
MRTFIFLLFCFSTGIVSAQKIEYQLIQSNVFEDEKYKTTLLFAEEDTNGDIYVVRNFLASFPAPKGYYIERYNAALELLDRTIIPIERSEVRGLFLKEGKVALIEFRYVQKEKSYNFYLLESSKEKFSFSEKEILSIDRSKMDKYDHYGIRKEIEYNSNHYYEFGDVVTSDNKEFFSISVLFKQKKGNAFKIHTFTKEGVLLYDYLLDEIDEKTLDKKYKKTPLLVYQNMLLGDDGVAYLLAKIYYNGSLEPERKGKPNYNYELFKITGSSRHKQKSLLVGDNFMFGMQLVASQDKLFAVGVYNDELPSLFKNSLLYLFSKLEGNDGVVRFEVDKELFSEVKTYDVDFSEIIKEDLKPKGRSLGGEVLSFVSGRDKFNKAGVIAFVPHSVQLLPNNDIVLMLEQRITTVANNGMSSTSWYGNTILLKVNGQGELIYDRGIKKSSINGNLNKVPNHSFASLINEKGSYILFNGEAIPEKLEDGRMIFENTNDNYAHIVRVSGRGQKHHQRAFHWLDEKVSFEFRFAKQISENKLLVEVENDKNPQLMVIEITN